MLNLSKKFNSAMNQFLLCSKKKSNSEAIFSIISTGEH